MYSKCTVYLWKWRNRSRAGSRGLCAGVSDLIQLRIECSAHSPSGRGAQCRHIVGGLLSGKLLGIALLVLNGLWTEPTEWILLVSSVYFMTQVSVGSL